MRKLLVLMLVLPALGILAQSPRLINYQGALRNSNDVPLAEKNFSIRFRLLQGTGSTQVYTEQQSVTTDALGLFATQIGKNNATGMAALNFSAGDLFLVVGIDTTGGTSYTDFGDPQRLASVPFSMYALTVPSSYTNGVLSIGERTYNISSQLQGSGAGIATLTSSGLNFTVLVPPPALTSNGNTISLSQGTVVTSATVGAMQPTLTATGNTLTFLQGPASASVALPPPLLVLSGANNNSLSAGSNTVTLNTYDAGSGIVINTSGSGHTISAVSTSFQSQGIASVSPQSGNVITVLVPGPAVSFANNVLTLSQGTVVTAATISPPALTLSGPFNNSLTAGANTVAMNSYTAGNGITMSVSGTSHTISAVSTTFQSQGIASVSPQSGNVITVSVPGPNVSYSGNVLTLTQGTVVTTATIAQPALTLTGVSNNSLTSGTNTVTLNTYTAGNGLSLAGTVPNLTLSANTTGTNVLWSSLGNAGTSTLTNFIGTTDNVALNFRVNNQKAGQIDPILFNTFFGRFAGAGTGTNNTAIGYSALGTNVSGSWNTGVGHNALSNNSSGTENSGLGLNVLSTNSTGYENSAIGARALTNNTTGYYNSAVGSLAGFNNTIGARNTAVGYNSGVISGTLNNASAFGANAKVGLSNSMVLGDTSNVNVGLGTGYPTRKLHVKGQVRIVDGSQAAGKVLTSDAQGNAGWAAPSYSAPGITVYTSGTGTYTPPAGALYLKVRMVGGGGGASNVGGGLGGAANGTAGAATTFGSNLLIAGGGDGGYNWSGLTTGGSYTVNSPAIKIVGVNGADGNRAPYQGSAGSPHHIPGGAGGSSFFGGAGAAGDNFGGATSAKPNSGSGGGGGGLISVPSSSGGQGGAAGGYLEAMIANPASAFTYSVGTGGVGPGSGVTKGGDGGSGVIIIEAHFQ
jgi:hypothetical protein